MSGSISAGEGGSVSSGELCSISNGFSGSVYPVFPHIKTYWKLSKQAIAYRAKEIKAVSQKTYTYFMIELSRRGERMQEFGEVSLDTPQLLKDVVKIHKNELGYTSQEMADIINLTMSDYKEFFEPNSKLRIVYD